MASNCVRWMLLRRSLWGQLSVSMTSARHTLTLPTFSVQTRCVHVSHVRGRKLEAEIAETPQSVPNAVDIDGVLAEVSQHHSKNKTQHTVNINHLEELVKVLAYANIKTNDIVACLKNSYHNFTYSVKMFENRVTFLRKTGFHPNQVATLLSHYPEIVRSNSRKITDVMSAYRTIGVPDGRVQVVFSQVPALFDLHPNAIEQRRMELSEIFTKKEVIWIASNQPAAFIEQWRDIKDKIDYVLHTMGLQEKHLLLFQLFSHSLHHIQLRHSFLEKAGIYQKPDKNRTTEVDNPSISRIMDTPDNLFAYQVARLSPEELQAYQRIMEFDKMAAKMATDEDMSDSDYDSDDDTKEHRS